MELVTYEPWHFEYLAMPMPQGRNLGPEVIRMYALAYSIRGEAHTIKDKGKIVGCAGVLSMWPGVAEAWTIFSKEAKENPFFIHRQTYRILRKIINKNQFRRVQAIVCSADPVSTKWIERLGFVKESVMKKFGADGSDHAMYVWSL